MTPTLLGQSSLDHHRQSATSLVAAETAEEVRTFQLMMIILLYS